MDGYSVPEAASVLGVPTERVWELLARGVLASASDPAGGIRVFLRGAAPEAPAVQDDRRTDGSRGESAGESSPFRELLTEFRSLTERYGQALLALGEARGEVAALRSRVDLLEARVELRLPGSVSPMPAAGRSPAVGDAMTEAEPPRRRKPRTPHPATEGFAEALARAEDPSLPDVAAAETEPVAAVEGEAVAGAAPDAPPADGGPAEDAERSIGTEETSPAEAASPRDEETAAAADGTGETEEARPDLEAAHEGAADEVEVAAEEQPEDEVAAQAPVMAAPEEQPASQLGDAGARTEGSEQGPPASAPQPAAWESGPYTARIEEPDWLSEEDVADQLPEPVPAVEAPPSRPPATTPDRYDGEETMLWLGEPAEAVPPEFEGEMESAPGRSAPPPGATTPQARQRPLVTPSPAPESELPGSRQLDEALAALDALARQAPASQPARPAEPPLTVTPSAAAISRGPASRAYQRLRRIFPG